MQSTYRVHASEHIEPRAARYIDKNRIDSEILVGERKISYKDIYKGIYGAVQSFDGGHHVHLDDLEQADKFSRDYVKFLFGV